MSLLTGSTAMAVEIESLRQQLAAHLKREVMLRDRAQAVIDRWETPLWKEAEPTATVIYALREALAATADLSGLILCHAEPSLYFYPPTGKTLHASRIEKSRKETWKPLYRAWEPK